MYLALFPETFRRFITEFCSLNSLNPTFFSIIRKDDKVVKLLSDDPPQAGVDVWELQFHQKCYDQYTHTKSLKKLERENNEEDVENTADETDELRRSSSRKRDRFGKKSFK